MKLDLNLMDKAACVTGAASGIGRSISDAFLACGSRVLSVDLKYSEDGKGGALSVQNMKEYTLGADLRHSEDARMALEECERLFGRLDVLVNCAGIEMPGTVVELSEEAYDKVMDTNVKSMFLTCKHAIPLILR